ncbi:Intraflagellar transport protein 52 [Gaertneriomyces sp. JEL0708]|nr:Intraflagellar transport protein 52 [Gaertneriomyces sp. JEL0708]
MLSSLPGLGFPSSQTAIKHTLLFSITHAESHTPSQGYKQLCRKLRNAGWKIGLWKDDINAEKLINYSADGKGEGEKGRIVLVVAGCRKKWTAGEFDQLNAFLNLGGSILYMTGEGGESAYDTNFNYLLEELGIMVNPDSVVRTVYQKYFHPKEVLIQQGVLNRALLPKSTKQSSFPIIYPYGATLSVQKPGIPLLSTGCVSYPVNRPICAGYMHRDHSESGRLVVCGSIEMFSDTYVDKESNYHLLLSLLGFLVGELKLNDIDAAEPDVGDYFYMPNVAGMSESVRTCMQESEDTDVDVRGFARLFDERLFGFRTELVTESVGIYERLSVKKEPLRLIMPNFVTPAPPLTPAIFPPNMPSLPPPPLDLFDLDDAFASEKTRLAQLTNKCTDDDLEYYVRECGRVLGVWDKIKERKRSEKGDKEDVDVGGKDVLEYVLRSLVNWKCVEQ